MRSAASWGMGDLADLRQLAGVVGGRAGRGPRPGQPAARRRARVPPGGQPLLPEQPAVPQPALPAGGGRARGAGRPRRPPRRAGRRGAGAQRGAADRPGRGVAAQARRPRARCGPPSPADPALRPLAGRRRATRSTPTPPSAPWSRTTAATGRRGRRRSATPTGPRWRPSGQAHADRVRFHEWLQWLVDLQLESASTAGVAVMHDLAVGVDPGGADAWLWQDVFALDMAVGAPPDEFNTRGQDWGLPPFDPWRLRAAGYGPFVETIRAGLRHAGGLRVDHVMGLFRLFWIPRGQPAADGAYVRYPASELLDIVALESHRAGAYVVGEDLGTVEDQVRAEMAAPRPAVVPAAVVRGPAAAGVPGAGPGRRHHPRPAHRRRAVDGLRPRATSAAWAWSPTRRPPTAMCRRLQRHGRRRRRRPARRGRRPACTPPSAPPPCLLLAAALDDAVGRGRATQHARDRRRVAQLVDRPARAAGGARWPTPGPGPSPEALDRRPSARAPDRERRRPR